MLSDAELAALCLARRGVLSSRIPKRTQADCLGLLGTPGLRVFRKLERAGLILETEEDPIEIGGISILPTSSFEITEAGEDCLAAALPR